VGWDGLVAALTDHGSLVSWQDGDDAPPMILRPGASAAKCRSRFVAVAVATGMTVVAVAEDGSLWSWRPTRDGDPAAPDLEPAAWPCSSGIAHPARVAELSCGRRHVALRDQEGLAWTYGWGLYGQLGHGDSKDCETPTVVAVTKGRGGRGRCIDVACGGWHTAFLLCAEADRIDGGATSSTLATRLLTCGWNEGGQLGHSCQAVAGIEDLGTASQPAQESSASSQNQGQANGSICSVPATVPALDGIPMSAVACGSRYTLVATVAGELFAFGWSVRGELNRTLSSADSTPAASKRRRVDTPEAQEHDHDDKQQYWHEPVCLTTVDEAGSTFSSAATVDGPSLSSGGWHASVGIDFE
jgi:alpha-tubulin suppressor-like RCC1 family protein